MWGNITMLPLNQGDINPLDSFDLSCENVTLSYVTRFAKRVLYLHSFKSHFLLPFNEYSNALTVHVCSIARH